MKHLTSGHLWRTLHFAKHNSLLTMAIIVYHYLIEMFISGQVLYYKTAVHDLGVDSVALGKVQGTAFGDFCPLWKVFFLFFF